MISGMFLWARLVLEYLTTNMFLRKAEVMGAVDTLPRELRELFVIASLMFSWYAANIS